MAAAEKKAIYTARVGNVRVPVHRYAADGRYVVIWRQIAGGPRLRETFSTKAAATTLADEIAAAIANSQADVITLSSADRDNYRLAVQALAPFGIPLHAAIAEFVAARALIPGATLLDAAQRYSIDHTARLTCPPSAQILSELLAELEDDRREHLKYVPGLKRALEAFVKAFPDLSTATEVQLREYLRGLRLRRAFYASPKGAPVSPRTRDNVRNSIVRLFRFAKKRGYLDETKTSPIERIPKQAEGAEVSTADAAKLAVILNYFAERDPDWLPWAAIAAFSGLRTSEIFRLDWSAFRWDLGTISVRRSVARKVRVSRQVPILPALAAWLAEHKASTGPVIPAKWKSVEGAHRDAVGRLRKRLKWTVWDRNILRHSFGSHRLAIVKSIAQVAMEMGNSPAKVRENYNDPKGETEAERYFAVRPPAPVENIVPMRYQAGDE